MKRVFWLLGAALMLISGTAEAQTITSNCGWQEGVFVCFAKGETATSTTSTLCASGALGGGCSTKTVAKEPPPGPGSSEDVSVSAGEARREAATRYNDPGAHILACPPSRHMTAQDGCQ